MSADLSSPFGYDGETRGSPLLGQLTESDLPGETQVEFCTEGFDFPWDLEGVADKNQGMPEAAVIQSDVFNVPNYLGAIIKIGVKVTQHIDSAAALLFDILQNGFRLLLLVLPFQFEAKPQPLNAGGDRPIE